MKNKVWILALCLGVALQPAHSTTRVFLLGGQSNMLGQGLNSELTPPYDSAQNDVNYWSNGAWIPLAPGFGNASYRFGPEVAFGRAIKDALTDDIIYLIKYSVGGTALYNDWKPPTGSKYINFMNTANAALADLDDAGIAHEISGMLWMQGESDAAEGEAASYETNLNNFIADMRVQFNTADMPFIIARVRDYYGGGGTPPTQADIVRAAQVRIGETDPRASWFDTDAYQMVNSGHYGTQGQLDLGKDFAAACLAYVPPVLSSRLASSGTKMEISWNSFLEVTYGVETNSNLINDTEWKTFKSDIAGTGSELSTTNTIGSAQTFYRIITK